MSKEEVIKEWKEVRDRWVKSQGGACMCLGNCRECGFHRCNGCLCVFEDFFIKALTSQKEELKKRIEGKRIVVEEKEKGTYYAQHCNGYNQALDDIITELNHQ